MTVTNGDVVQIDNALLSKKLDGSVEASAEVGWIGARICLLLCTSIQWEKE